MSEMPNSRVELAAALQNRRAQRGIDHRHRLVGQDDARLQQQRAGDHDALALAAAQLMRDSARASPLAAGRPAAGLLDQLSRLFFGLGQAELARPASSARGPPCRTGCRPRTGPGRSPAPRGGSSSARADHACAVWPRYRIEPLVGWISPSSSRARVVLPLPLSPAMAVMDGLSSLMVSETSSTATVWPLRQQPAAKDSGDVLALPAAHAHALHAPSYRWQATQRSGRTSSRTGCRPNSACMTCGQRGWNMQPGGGVSSDGVSPGMPWKSSFVCRVGRLR